MAGTTEHVAFGVSYVFVCASHSTSKSSNSQLVDADADLPDIAEAEAVLLDLARVFADPGLNAALPV